MPTGADIDLLSVGGTGLAGRAVVAEAVGRGLRVRVLSRHVPDAGSPVRVAGAEYVAGDILTGAGVQAALAGVRALVDTTNGTTRATRPTLTVGARVLTDAAALAGVRRLVLLSIVNVDRSDFAYYQVPAGLGDFFRPGQNVAPDRRGGTVTFEEWLASSDGGRP